MSKKPTQQFARVDDFIDWLIHRGMRDESGPQVLDIVPSGGANGRPIVRFDDGTTEDIHQVSALYMTPAGVRAQIKAIPSGSTAKVVADVVTIGQAQDGSAELPPVAHTLAAFEVVKRDDSSVASIAPL